MMENKINLKGLNLIERGILITIIDDNYFNPTDFKSKYAISNLLYRKSIKKLVELGFIYKIRTGKGNELKWIINSEHPITEHTDLSTTDLSTDEPYEDDGNNFYNYYASEL